MEPFITGQHENALGKKQNDPTEHRKAVNDDERHNLAGQFAPAPFAVQNERPKSDRCKNQHQRGRDNVKQTIGAQRVTMKYLLACHSKRVRHTYLPYPTLGLHSYSCVSWPESTSSSRLSPAINALRSLSVSPALSSGHCDGNSPVQGTHSNAAFQEIVTLP